MVQYRVLLVQKADVACASLVVMNRRVPSVNPERSLRQFTLSDEAAWKLLLFTIERIGTL